MRSIIASVAAAGVLVAGAFVASTLTTTPADAQTAALVATDDQGPIETVFDDVLRGLVDDGTLSEDQAAAVKQAFAAKHEELREQREERREERLEQRELIQEFLEDGVVDADELAQLPDDHPFNDEDGRLADALEDGELTREEIREGAHEWRHDRWERRRSLLQGGATGDDA